MTVTTPGPLYASNAPKTAAITDAGAQPVSIQDANCSLQLILSHQGHPTLPLVVTDFDPTHNHLIATLPLHSHSHTSCHSPPHQHGPPSPATVAAVANATTALLPIFLFLHSATESPAPSSSAPPPSTMVPWSSVSFDQIRSPSSYPSTQPVAWLLQAHGSLQSIGRRQHNGHSHHHHPATALASVDVFLVDALGKHPAQLLVSSRVPAAALPVPPMVAANGKGQGHGWVVGSKM